jgi:DNA-binding CsgD family transcriptional regulator
MRRTWGVGVKPGSLIDPAGQKHLLSLHAAMDIDSFWKATQQLLAAVIPNHLVGLTLQHNPILPPIARWTLPMPDGFFVADPVKSYVVTPKHKKIVRIADLFSNRSSFLKSAFHRRYLGPSKCGHAVCLFFRERQRLICTIVIMRTASQGDLSPVEMKLLRELHPQFLTALRCVRSLGRERAVRMDFEEFLRPLPLPTMVLRWNLKLIYQNRAARDFCNVWEKGSEQARLTKTAALIPSEILDRCRRLKEQWVRAQQRPRGTRGLSKGERVHHPRSPDLRATVRLKQLNSADLARPHFLIELEDLRRHAAPSDGQASSDLPHLVRLTGREQEVARLVCDGRSNQEIADAAGLSLQMVKKHLHAIFQKLEVPSRSRLMALMR